MFDVKKIVKNNEAHLVFFIDGLFIYRVLVDGVFRIFSFSSSDVKNSEIKPTEKAITLMKFIDSSIKSDDFNVQALEPEPITQYARLIRYKDGGFFFRVVETGREFFCQEKNLMYTQEGMTSSRFAELFEAGHIIFLED